MIHYHGTPITPLTAAVKALTGRHAMVSFAHPEQIGTIAEVCQSFVLDNGAFSFWKAGKPVAWEQYCRWLETWLGHPGCDWAVIPDVIDGTAEDNDELIRQWPFGVHGVPVWHLHEPIARLVTLCDSWPRVAIGSSGEWSQPGTERWWQRMAQAMDAICEDGVPCAKLHGLRMLNPAIFTRLPLASADSTMVAVNIGLDSRWNGTFTPPNKDTRALVLAERIEAHQSSARWEGMPQQFELEAIA